MAWFVELCQGMMFVLMAYLSVAQLVAARSSALPAMGVASDLSTAEKAEDTSPSFRHRSRDEGLAGSLPSCVGPQKSTTNNEPPCNIRGDVRRLARHLALQGVDAKLVAAAVQGLVAGRHIRASTVLPPLPPQPQQQQQRQQQRQQQQQQLGPMSPSGSGALFCEKTERGSKLRRRARRAAARQQQQQPPSATSSESQHIATKASVDDRVSPATLSSSSQQEQQQQRQQTWHSPTANGPPSLAVTDPRQQQQKRSQPQMEHQQKQPLRQSGRLTSKRQQDSRPRAVR